MSTQYNVPPIMSVDTDTRQPMQQPDGGVQNNPQQHTDPPSDKYKNYNCGKRYNRLKVNSHRKGPVPIEDCLLTNATQV